MRIESIAEEPFSFWQIWTRGSDQAYLTRIQFVERRLKSTMRSDCDVKHYGCIKRLEEGILSNPIGSRHERIPPRLKSQRYLV
jgi:hypothetical protein